MKVAVTGASGFIGRALCPALGAAGHAATALELRAAEGRPDLSGCGAVVHLAAIAHRDAAAAELERVNVELAARTGAAAAAAGCRMIFMSSVKVHGEESAAPLRETSPIAPRDAYAASKARAEEALRAVPGLELTVLRAPLVYGPGVKANFLALMKAIDRGVPLPLAGVSNRRSLAFVGNLVDAVVRCIARRESAGRTYLVSDGRSLSTPELCRALGAALARPARLWPLPVALVELAPGAKRLTRSLELDDTAIRDELGWRPRHSLDQALGATARWYRGR